MQRNTLGRKQMEAKRTDPWIPIGHPDFVWTPGADVQATWRRYGWTPPSEKRPPVVVETKDLELVSTWRVK